MAKNRKHPGITIYKDGGRWRAAWLDPDTGKRRREWLPVADARNEKTREQWGERKFSAITKRRREIEAGAPARRGISVATAIDVFLNAKRAELAEKSIAYYETAGALLARWAAIERIATSDDLSAARLALFRDWLLRAKRDLAPRSLKTYLGAVRGIAIWWAVRGMCPADETAIIRVLEPPRVPRQRPDFYDAGDCRWLILAAMAHDRKPQTWPKAAWVATLLLTGCRAGEIARLTWADLELPRQIVVHKSKTGVWRPVSLDIAPGLAAMLARLREAHTGKPTARVFRTETGSNLTPGGWRNWADSINADLAGVLHFEPQKCRRTCSTFTVAMFGAAVESQRAGHSITEAERSYFGLLPRIVGAETLEAAMAIDDLIAQIASDCGKSVETIIEKRTQPRRR